MKQDLERKRGSFVCNLSLCSELTRNLKSEEEEEEVEQFRGGRVGPH